VDQTLAILYSSAVTAGHPGHLISNLAFLTDVYQTRAWLDTKACHRRAGEWQSQASKSGNQGSKKSPGLTSMDHIQLSAWSALGELALATEDDVRMLVGQQEQRGLPFARLTIPRSTPESPKKSQQLLVKYVGKSIARPHELKA
jgi:hypothetical protein